jgi:hypothetical protein
MSNVMVLQVPAAGRRVRRGSDSAARPNFVLRRTIALFLAVAVAVLLAAAVSGLLAGPGGDPASASGAQPAAVAEYHLAQPGESLWTIAMEYHGEVPVDRFVGKLISLNGGSSQIQVGQAVWLP